MKYNAKFFRNQLPEWKRKKDSIMARLIYREISFHVSAFFSNLNIGANMVSYISIGVAVIGALLFLLPYYKTQIIGALLINIWTILDCADGNMARCVKKEPFGEFADGLSSYILVALMCTCFGVSVYSCGGLFIPQYWPWIIVIGAFASSSDTLMRLAYQKYKNNERQLADSGVLEVEKDMRTDISKVSSIRVRIEAEFGLSATMTFILLVVVIFRALDLMVIYYYLYYGLSCLFVLVTYIRKAIIAAKKYKIEL